MIPERSSGAMNFKISALYPVFEAKTAHRIPLDNTSGQRCGHHETTKSQEDFRTNEDFQANNLLYLPNNCKESPNVNSGILEKLCVQTLKVLGSGNYPSLVCNLSDPPVQFTLIHCRCFLA